MKAIAYQNAGDASVLQDINQAVPTPQGHDLLVAVHAVSVNPVDTKIRKGVNAAAGQWKVLGWDATGVVRAV
ncbi:MAG: alcohol dehydrogenase catalytic domain-containing protein, partial [Deefgea sp.]